MYIVHIFLTSGLNLWRFNIQLANVKVPENMYNFSHVNILTMCGHEMSLLLRLRVG